MCEIFTGEYDSWEEKWRIGKQSNVRQMWKTLHCGNMEAELWREWAQTRLHHHLSTNVGHWLLYLIGLSEEKYEICLRSVCGVVWESGGIYLLGPITHWSRFLPIECHLANVYSWYMHKGQATEKRQLRSRCMGSKQTKSGCICMRAHPHRAGYCHRLQVRDRRALSIPRVQEVLQ